MVIVRAGVLVGALLLVMVPVLVSSSARSLLVYSSEQAQAWCIPVKSHDSMQLQFTHSMFGGFVREEWQVTPNNQLQRNRFVTENAAAAEYYATDGTSYLADDGYVVPGPPLQQSELVIRVNNRGNHVLTVGTHTVYLAEELTESTQVRIEVVARSCDNGN